MSAFPQPGEVFNRRYELQEVLGRGGIGTVFKALQLDCNRVVALKILHPEWAADEDFKKRFIREARALNELRHTGIVTIYHIGLADTGLPYIVMEYICGKSVRQLLDEDTKLCVLRGINIARQAADALHYVHENGIIHRDLKPENLVTVEQPEPDTVKLIDFGLARFLKEDRSTRTGSLIGSVMYMSPEQCQGKPVDRRADIYSLAVCFYEMLTGKKLFSADNSVGMMYLHMHQPPPAVTIAEVDQYNRKINEVLSRGLAKQPEDRYQSMEEFSSDLLQLANRIDHNHEDQAEPLPPRIFHFLTRLGRRQMKGSAQRGKNNRSFMLWSCVSFVLLCAAAAVVILYVKDSYHKSTEFLSISSARSSLLPKTVGGVESLYYQLASKENNLEGLNMLLRWENSYMKSPRVAAAAKIFVLRTLTSAFLTERKYPEAIARVGQLRSIDQSLPTKLFLARSMAAIYRSQFKPEEGIAEIESVLHKLPPENSEAAQGCLLVEGDCYFDEGNLQKALQLYKKAEELGKGFSELSFDTNLCRVKEMVALTMIGGKDKEVESIYSKCTDAASAEELLMGPPDSRLRASSSLPRERLLSILFCEFRDRGELKNYEKYGYILVDHYRSRGKPREAEKILKEMAWCPDNDISINAAKILLKSSPNFDNQLEMLVLVAQRYCYQTGQLSLAKEYEERAYSLIEKKLLLEPDLFIKHPSDSYARLMEYMIVSRQAPQDVLSQRLDSFINKCSGKDGLTLRCLLSVKVEYLKALGKYAEAGELCQKNVDFFMQRRTAEAGYLWVWLTKKGDVMLHAGKPLEALKAYKLALQVIGVPASQKAAVQASQSRRDLLARIAVVNVQLGDSSEAENYYAEVEREFSSDSAVGWKTFTENDAEALLNLGKFYQNKGEFAKAAGIYARAERVCIRKFGSESCPLVKVLYSQGLLLRQEGQISVSAARFQRVISMGKNYLECEKICKDSAQMLKGSPPALERQQ